MRELSQAPVTSLICQQLHSHILCLLSLTDDCLLTLSHLLKVITPAIHPSLLDHSHQYTNMLVFLLSKKKKHPAKTSSLLIPLPAQATNHICFPSHQNLINILTLALPASCLTFPLNLLQSSFCPQSLH